MFRYLFRHWATFSSLILGMTFGAMTNMAMLGWAPVWLVRRFAWRKTGIGFHLGITITCQRVLRNCHGLQRLWILYSFNSLQ